MAESACQGPLGPHHRFPQEWPRWEPRRVGQCSQDLRQPLLDPSQVLVSLGGRTGVKLEIWPKYSTQSPSASSLGTSASRANAISYVQHRATRQME